MSRAGFVVDFTKDGVLDVLKFDKTLHDQRDRNQG